MPHCYCDMERAATVLKREKNSRFRVVKSPMFEDSERPWLLLDRYHSVYCHNYSLWCDTSEVAWTEVRHRTRTA